MVTLLLVGGQFPPLTQLRTGPAQIDTRTQETRSAAMTSTLRTSSSVPLEPGKVCPPGRARSIIQPSESPKGKAAVGDPQRLSDNEQLEILTLLEAVSTE